MSKASDGKAMLSNASSSSPTPFVAHDAIQPAGQGRGQHDITPEYAAFLLMLRRSEFVGGTVGNEVQWLVGRSRFTRPSNDRRYAFEDSKSPARKSMATADCQTGRSTQDSGVHVLRFSSVHVSHGFAPLAPPSV